MENFKENKKQKFIWRNIEKIKIEAEKEIEIERKGDSISKITFGITFLTFL